MTFLLPDSVELDVCIKEAHHGGSGRVPAVYPRSNQTLSLAVPHNLHQAWVTLVHILVQIKLQLHCRQ